MSGQHLGYACPKGGEFITREDNVRDNVINGINLGDSWLEIVSFLSREEPVEDIWMVLFAPLTSGGLLDPEAAKMGLIKVRSRLRDDRC